MSLEKITFYIASSYLNKSNVNKLSKALMNADRRFRPTFPWWMYSQEEDKHHGHQGAVGELEITGAGDADVFVWLKTARKGGWAELGAACYTSAYGHNNHIIMLIPESEAETYLPPFAYQMNVIRKLIPDKMFSKPKELASVILEMYNSR
jgi:hypothetical protein